MPSSIASPLAAPSEPPNLTLTLALESEACAQKRLSTADSSSPFSSARSLPSTKKAGDSSPKQKKVRRRPRIVLTNPPSAFHPDIYPPGLARVQRALRAKPSKRDPLRPSRLHAGRAVVASPFRDAEGQFVLQGSSGGFYAGNVLGGLPHGVGEHHIPHPASGKLHKIYDGEWAYGDKTGFGSVFYTNGEEYRGELRNNQRWGRGWMKYKDGSFYCGDWLRGRRHGFGLHIPILYMQHPTLPIFNIVAALRAFRAAECNSNILFKTQVGRKDNLTSPQLQILKQLFEMMVPMTEDHAQLHVVHFRRMLLLARIDPDIGQGEKLLAHLQMCAAGRDTITFNEMLQSIMQFHHP